MIRNEPRSFSLNGVMSSSEVGATKPQVLFVYYTYTQQSLRVVEAMADVFRERGCETRQAGIEFTDKRWAERFSRLPLRHAVLDILGMLLPQLRGATGEIRIPDEAREATTTSSASAHRPGSSGRVCRSARF